jgi:hypothetical protein
MIHIVISAGVAEVEAAVSMRLISATIRMYATIASSAMAATIIVRRENLRYARCGMQ